MDFSLLRAEFSISRKDGQELTDQEASFCEYVSERMEDVLIGLAEDYVGHRVASHTVRCTCRKEQVSDTCPIHGLDDYTIHGSMN